MDRKTPTPTPTPTQLRALRKEALAAGDQTQAVLCTLALAGEHRALAECGLVIQAAKDAAS